MKRGVSGKGRKKYKCGNCYQTSFHHWIEANRASGIRCTACGSRNMELVTEEARQEAADAQLVRTLGGTRSTHRPQERPDRKVT